MAGSDLKFAGDVFGKKIVVSGTCEHHGGWSVEVFEFLADRVKCDKCVIESRELDEARKAEEQRAASEKRRMNDLSERGVSLRHLDKTFDTFIADTQDQRAVLAACKGLAEAAVAQQKRIPSLILSGGPGTGKTHLTCAIIQHCYDAGCDALKANVMQIIRDIKASWRKGSDSDEEGVISWYADRDVLVIDEIGVQFGTDTERMYVFDIINRRYENCLPTVLITNLDISGLRAEIGDRVLDRLREDGGRMLVMTGKSWRAQ